jgi:hypothetical protein
MKVVGLTMEITLRHETAHCNGWPNDHRGALPIEDWAPDATDALESTPPVMKVAAQFDNFARSAVGKNVMDVADNLSRINKAQFISAAVAIGLTPGSQLTGHILSDPAIAVPLARAAGIGIDLPELEWQQAHALASQTSRARQAFNAIGAEPLKQPSAPQQPGSGPCGLAIQKPCE